MRLLISLLIYVLVCGPLWPAHATIDPTTNFAFATLSQGYDNDDTSIVVTTGFGTKFPATFAYNLTWWNCTDYGAPHLDPSVEIVRVTNRVSDTFTVTRAQEGTSAVNHNTSGKTYCLARSLTKKDFDDIRTDIQNAGGSINDVVDASTYADLNTAITDLCGSSALKTLRISDSQTVSSNITVCPNVTIWIIGSGLISINNTVVLTIQAPMIAPARKIFDGLGTVAGLTFSRGEWFDCKRDGSTDDTACLQKAADAIAAIGGQLNLGVGTYKITSSLSIGSYVQIQGFGPAATFIKGALTTNLIRSPNFANKYSLWHLKDFTIDNTNKTNAGGICLNMTNIDDAVIENVYLQNCDTGLLMSAGSSQSANNNVLRDLVCLTANTCYSLRKAEWTSVYNIRGNNVTNCIDIDDDTYISLYSPKCEAFTNGIRVGREQGTTHTKIFAPMLKNTPTVGTGISIASNATRTFVWQPHYVGLTTNYTNASGTQAILWDAGTINNLQGISASDSSAVNLRGSCTFSASTTCAVTFANTQADALYTVQLTCGANKTFWWSSKATTGFTINGSSSGSDTCDWMIIR